MEFSEVVARRRMVRRYRDEPIPPDVLHDVLATALRGPSAGFSQGVRLVAVTDHFQRRKIAAACGEEEYVAAGYPAWLSVAPAHVVITVREGDYRERYAEPDKAKAGGPDTWSAPYWWVDSGAALMLLLLAAVDHGLDAGVLDIARPDIVRTILDIPPEVSPVCLVTIGYRDEGPLPTGSARRGRRPAQQAIFWERWTGATAPDPATRARA